MVRQLHQLARIPVTELHGVGPSRAEALAEVGVASVLDLLTYYPRNYLDRTEQATIRELRPGEEAAVLATVKRVMARRARSGRTLVEVDATDGTGFVRCTFFNQPWRAKQLHDGMELVLFGRLEIFNGRRRMTNPVVDLVGDRTGRIVAVYPQSGRAGLTTWDLSGWIEEALQRAGELADPLPPEIRERFRLVSRTWAMRQIHAPDSMASRAKARRRLAFDELLRLQTELARRKRAIERDAAGISHDAAGALGGGGLVARFREQLVFGLTGAQERAVTAIAQDLAAPRPMHRLLQGDVGSGKTLVAACALLVGVQGGYQGALMAPTEVLAEQHHLALRTLLGALEVPDSTNLWGTRPVRVELLTSRTTTADRERVLEDLAGGQVDLLVGTHALLTEPVGFHSLGVVVIDEQHRFGVEQRAALRRKGEGGVVPDVLVMTATPIPRTVAMTLYGDLDVTELDELPPGRTPVTTVWARGSEEEARAWEQVRGQAALGYQAYVVCPLVEESDRVQARAATEEYERLTAYELEGLRVGLLHGQMAGREKGAAMEALREEMLDVLVATTVIEVGVDVPNATVMVILDADRFGLAQLHQLRGRVGRGNAASWCYLLSGATAPEAVARLSAFTEISDGFRLAETDLELRGEGAVLGTRQKGRSDLKLASLRRDRDLLREARDLAFELVGDDPALGSFPMLAAEIDQLMDEEAATYLFKS